MAGVLHGPGSDPIRALGLWEVHGTVVKMGFDPLSFSKRSGDYDP